MAWRTSAGRSPCGPAAAIVVRICAWRLGGSTGGDGVVITSINGRQDTRCYAKTVQRGTSVHNLSDEEEQAIREAMTGRREVARAR